MDRTQTNIRGVDAVMGNIKIYTDRTADWDKVGESLDLYFERKDLPDQCGIGWGDKEELYVFEYSDMKFENEDQWGDDEE